MEGCRQQIKSWQWNRGDYLYAILQAWYILAYVFLSLTGGKMVGLRIIYQKSGFAEVQK